MAKRWKTADFVPNSSDGEASEGEIIVSNNRRALKEVSIPVMAQKKAAKGSASTSPTDTTLSSLGSSPRGTSTEYESPGTTPAASIKGVPSAKRKRSMLGNVIKMEDSEEEDADSALARRLQEEEYAQAGAPNKRLKSGKWSIEDSEDDVSELSEPESLASLDSAPLRTRIVGKGKGKQAVTPATKGKLPVRTASSGARKSLSNQKRRVQIDDSESEAEELSELASEDDSFAEEESEAISSGVSDAESAVVVVPASTSRSRGTSSGRGRGRGAGRKSRGRRFGNHTASDGEDMARGIQDVIANSMLTRKERERKKLEKAHPGIKTMWTDLKAIPVIKPVAAAQPQSINRRLKPFQLEGLDWMVKQEKSGYKGGLLGDEMGMGKTIQAVSLIMSDYPQKQPTLVVVPPVALMQWSTEIGEYTDGKLSVLVYHGQNSQIKKMTVSALKKYDVIMISYNSLESLYRKETKGWTRGDDIIKEDSPIHAIHFHRLILDEAHSIKSRTTGVAKACFALQGTYKWCLSGTPVQNRIGEFFSLLRFLEVRPFADYFCKRCPCSMLHWQLDEDHMCGSCKHSGMEHVSVFNQELLNPLTQSEDPADRTKAMDKLHLITARIMLRRMKRDHVSSMELPPKEVIVHNEFFGEIERDFSSSIMSNTTRQFDTYVAKGVMLNNYANIFGLM